MNKVGSRTAAGTEMLKKPSNPAQSVIIRGADVAFSNRSARFGPSAHRLTADFCCCRGLPKMKNHRRGIAGGFGGLAKSRLVSETKLPSNDLAGQLKQRYVIQLLE
ncbi:hypothetical protein [Bradyrhizobium sp. Tv2a-2]|uniref:hypothetical protein n=1 Tax=Bradyrhizobium sp. Tv2a-2 TaxID=113395 RepID=UPI0012EBCC51|nr:hypothetical protein [Bradyrhizobium sp. Tv2a-2]